MVTVHREGRSNMRPRKFGADNSSLLSGNDGGAFGRISFLEGDTLLRPPPTGETSTDCNGP